MNVTAIYNAASTVANVVSVEPEINVNKALNGIDGDVSLVTLSSAWSRVARLLLLASLAVGGSVGNVFMISAVVVEDQLNKRGTLAIAFSQLYIRIIDECKIYRMKTNSDV